METKYENSIIYQINSSAKHFDKLFNQYSKERSAFLKQANKIGKDDPFLDVWHILVKTDYSVKR